MKKNGINQLFEYAHNLILFPFLFLFSGGSICFSIQWVSFFPSADRCYLFFSEVGQNGDDRVDGGYVVFGRFQSSNFVALRRRDITQR